MVINLDKLTYVEDLKILQKLQIIKIRPSTERQHQ
jgi:hypothetical protein